MNLLPIANVVAAGFDWDYLWHWTHNDGLVKAVTAAVIAGIVSLGVAWWNGRKVDKQMELSKEATPPELTRYKEWLEISEKYKELVNFENVDALSKASKEYKEIEASRNAALERAVWERKVLAICPNAFLQKRLLAISPRVITDKNFNIYNFTYSYSRRFLKVVDVILTIAAVLCVWWWAYWAVSFLGIGGELGVNSPVKGNWEILSDKSISILIILMLLIWLNLFFKALFGATKDEYYIRNLVIEERGNVEIFLKEERNVIKNRLRLASMLGNVDFIYLPWGEGVRCSAIKRVWSVIHPMYYVNKGFKGKSDVIWGSYKEEGLNGDLENRIKGFDSWGEKLKKRIIDILKKLEIEDGFNGI